MKTIQNILSVTLKPILFLCVILITSCSKDDAPAAAVEQQNSNFVTLPTELIKTYTGILNYENANGIEITDVGSGTATISGTSSNYTITFNNNVPSINNIKFSLINGQYIHAIGGTVSDPDESVIVRTIPSLQLVIDRNGNSWAFNGE